MAWFFESQGNSGGRMSVVAHKIHGHGFHLVEKSLFLADKTSGVILRAAGYGEAVFSALLKKELELSGG